jgi:type IV conjugative transfer system protein TraE
MGSKYIELWENLKEKNRTLVIVIVLLISVIFILLQGITYLATHRTITLYVPGAPYAISVPSYEFAIWWARYFVSLLANFNYETIDGNLAVLNEVIDPELKKELLKQAAKIKKNRISQAFYIIEGSWEVNRKEKIVSVKGIKKVWIGDKLVEESKKKLVLKLRFEGGRFILEEWRYEDTI